MTDDDEFDVSERHPWTSDDDATLIRMLTDGQRKSDVSAALRRSIPSIHSRLKRLRGYGVLANDSFRGRHAIVGPDDERIWPRGRPVLSPAERVRRERERDRVKKRAMRARLVERYLGLTPVQAARLDRHRTRGGYRSTSALIAALIDAMPDRP